MAIKVRGRNSSKVLPLQPIAAHFYMTISIRGKFFKCPPIAAQLLHHFTPSEQITPTLLQHFYTPWQSNSYIILPLLNKLPPHSYNIFAPLGSQTLTSFYPLWTKFLSLLHTFTPLGSQTLRPFFPLWRNYPLTLTPIYTPWQTTSYLILPPLDKLHPHSFTILPPLAAQPLHHFTPTVQITPSLLHIFAPLGSQTLTSFYPLWTKFLSLLHTFTPLGSQTLRSFFPLWRNYPLTLTPFYPPWQPNPSIILPPLDKLLPHSYITLALWQPTIKWQLKSGGVIPQKSSHCSPLQPTLTWQFQSGGNSSNVLPLQPNSYIILPLLNKLPPHSYNIFTPLGSPTLTSFYHFWTNYPHTLTTFLHPLAVQLLHHFTPSEEITP